MDKKAVSELIAYVLLISLAIAMSGIIYAWLRFYVSAPFPEKSCPDVSLIIADYSCNDSILTLTVQNRGRFDIDSYLVKINNGTGDYNVYDMRGVQEKTVPGQSSTGIYDISAFGELKEVELEAIKDGALCENSVIRQGLAC